MADSGALAFTPHLLLGPLRGTPSENRPGAHAHGLENVTAARPLAAHRELAAEKETETGTGTERETILGGSVVVRGGGGDPGVVLGPSPGPGRGHGPEQGPTGEGPAPNDQPPESNLLRGKSVGAAGGLGRAVGLVVRDSGIEEALGVLKMVCLQKVPLIARAGRKIPTGLQKRVALMLRGTPVVAHAGKTTAAVAGTEESHGVVGAAEGLNAAGGAQGAVAATVASSASRMKQPTADGSPETTSQVQATIQGLTRTAASTKTGAVAGGKSLSRENLWSTGQAGHRRPAGLSGGHYPQMFRIITPRGREEDQEAGTGRRRSSRQRQQQQIPLKASRLPRQSQGTLRCL